MYPKRIDDEAVVRGVDDELIVFKSSDNKMHHLNATAAFLWNMCDGTSSSEEMVDALESVFGAPREMLTRDVASTLEELALRGLVSLDRNGPSD